MSDTQITIDRRFAIIDEWILDLDISDRALRLYALLSRYADKDTHKAFPSRQTLADRLRCSPKSVDRASQELVDAGVMTKEHRFNSSIVYTLVTRVQGGGHHSPGGWSPVSRGVDTSVHLTRTIELEPLNENVLNERARTLPDSWKPKDDVYTLEKYSVLDIDREAEAFMLFHTAKGTKYKNWDAAFRKWLNKGLDFHAEKHYKESERDLEKRRLDEWLASQMEDDNE